MDGGTVLGLSSADAERLFGPRLAALLSACDLEHPDLSRSPLSEFVGAAEQCAAAFSMCLARGLTLPAEMISAGLLKFDCGMVPMARLLSDGPRRAARETKSSSWISPDPASPPHSAGWRDVPSSFEAFSEYGQPAADSLRWNEMAGAFAAVGCELLAEMAARLSSEGVRDQLGLARLPVLRAAAILGKRMGPRSAGLRPFLVPFCRAALPEAAGRAVLATESALSGRPVFDHHLVVSYASREMPSEIDADFVVLGERDGVCYFVFAD